MLQQPKGDDLVVATGESHSVRELCEHGRQAPGSASLPEAGHFTDSAGELDGVSGFPRTAGYDGLNHGRSVVPRTGERGREKHNRLPPTGAPQGLSHAR